MDSFDTIAAELMREHETVVNTATNGGRNALRVLLAHAVRRGYDIGYGVNS